MSSRLVKDPLFEQVNFGPAIGLPLNEFQSVNLSFMDLMLRIIGSI
jgi:hypothetical protein